MGVEETCSDGMMNLVVPLMIGAGLAKKSALEFSNAPHKVVDFMLVIGKMIPSGFRDARVWGANMLLRYIYWLRAVNSKECVVLLRAP